MEILIEILMGILMGILMVIMMGIQWEFFMGLLMMVSMGWPYDSSDCLSCFFLMENQIFCKS